MALPVPSVSRRQFLGRSACNAAGLAAGLVGLSSAHASPSDAIRIGMIGVRRQGRKLATAITSQPNTVIATLCDIDETVLERAQREAVELGQKPTSTRDFRRVLDDPAIDAVVIATPDHSHVAIALQAIHAGKDVYLEAPVCHTVAEGHLLLAAAEASNRVVQAGMFDRSLEHIRNAINFVHSGRLGTVALAKAWAVHRRVPDSSTSSIQSRAGIDYSGWLYPRPERPFDPNRYHRGWNSYWDFGSGELGAWGVPLLDLARWGIQKALPDRVNASGGHVTGTKSETPNTLHVQFAFDDSTIIWEHRDWSNYAPEGRSAGVAFYGDAGTLILDRGGWKVYDSSHSVNENGRSDVTPHVAEFLAAVRTRRRSMTPLREAIISANICHLGNLAFRAGRELKVDPGAPLLVSDQGLQALAGAHYRPGVVLV